MAVPLAQSRRAGWVRGVLLIATLVIAVLIHHGVEHGMPTGSGEGAAMPGMTSIALPAANQPTAPSPVAQHQMPGAVAEASDSHLGCAGDQMCEASGIAKTPSTAHPATAASGIYPPRLHLAAGAVRHDPGTAAPPPTSAVLRI